MWNFTTRRETMHSACLVLFTLLVSGFGLVVGRTLRYRVYEEQEAGTVIGSLKEDARDVLSHLPNTVPLRFRSVQRGGASALAVRERDGEISVRGRLDREKLCDRNPNCSVEFDVLTLPTEHLQLFHVQVEILDVNDHAPRFPRAVIPLEISETASVGTRVPLDSAADPDVGENALSTYTLSASDTFGIDVLTGTNGAKYAELVVLKELDRETRSSYELRLTASDGGSPPRTGTTLLKIKVADSNDNNPIFAEPSYTIDLPEDAAPGVLLVDLNATDADEGTNGKIVYSFSSHVSPKVVETFRIDPDTGHLSLLRKVDFETDDSYDVDVQAQDSGPNSMPAHCKITIKVKDVNDNNPEVSVSLMGNDEEAALVSELAPIDTFVALVRVDDADSGLNGEVVCRLAREGHFRLQKTHEKNYVILTNATLDRETSSEYSLTIIAEDRGTPSLSTVRHFTVRVQDENDNAPHFDKNRYDIFKDENNSPGAYLATVHATDPDLATNGHVSYSVLEGMVHGSSISTYVTVDPSSGAIYALRTFDYEEISHISFMIQARDYGNPSLSSNVTVVLNVLDVNDNRPVIVSPPLRNHTTEFTISKYSDYGDLITTITATDRDSGVNGDLSCTITAGNEAGYFYMDSRTCEIRANVSLRDLKTDHVELMIMVQDHGSEPLETRALLHLSLLENPENLADPLATGGLGKENVLDASTIIIISLGAICGLLIIIMVALALRCSRDKNDTRSYNCRVAESTYQQRPRKPSRQIHKGDITLVPTVNGALPVHHHSPTTTGPIHHSHQSLNSIVTVTSNQIPESFVLELTHATPPVEQVSQLLSLLHQGQYQPRPSFRGNKHSRNYRYTLPDLDKFSLKDSGRGDSDSDGELGRDSPIDRLLGDGFSELFHIDTHSRVHSAMKLCTEECRVLGHSDQCWMPSFSAEEERRSFSTFGKDADEEEEMDDGGEKSLLSDINSVFHRIVPPSHTDPGDLTEGSTPCGVTNENRKCFLPGNSHFQNSANHVSNSKWLPAMEEIPENYEEDEMESTLGFRKRTEDEFAAEINKLLLDVHQS
ncbi:protocadherin-18a isoform X1 [Tachysurus vachellii]|uniref:protocadherin-18a isoform X1 n=1 Tax=Tachysurus vachellii TaxID=175792 RepID=UPI00296B49B6|nr:protocadherin-18a isoform X1 [Tachysurus vachellii]